MFSYKSKFKIYIHDMETIYVFLDQYLKYLHNYIY